jgi:hypothetical protein
LAGLLAFTVYNYAIYTFTIHFGPLFLVWVAVLGLSVFALIGGLATLDAAAVKAPFGRAMPIAAWGTFQSLALVEEDFGGGALVHGLVALGGSVEGQGEVEDLAGVDLAAPAELDEFGEVLPDRAGPTWRWMPAMNGSSPGKWRRRGRRRRPRRGHRAWWSEWLASWLPGFRRLR